MPIKANQDRRHLIPKQRHRVTNWAAYDIALRQRGSLTRQCLTPSAHGRMVWRRQIKPEGAGKGKPGALAAGQHADWGAGLLGAEQEIFHVADHMAALAADGHGVSAAAGECLSQALFRVEGFAPLIENSLGEVGAEPDLAGLGHP